MSPWVFFNGHVAGVTCVSSKEDNRYFISNSKDQSIKLWDIRKACNEKKKIDMCHTDYRYNTVNRMSLESAIRSARSADQSLMTFQGHQVHTTLIRCHFSPLYGTGQRYVYSGSYDGIVYIYDTVTGENIMKLELPKGDGYYSDSVVRDCAWHPYTQSLITTSFDGEFHKWEYMDLRDAEKIGEEDLWEDDDEDANGEAYLVQEADGEDGEDDDDYDEEYEDEDEDDEEYKPIGDNGEIEEEEEDCNNCDDENLF